MLPLLPSPARPLPCGDAARAQDTSHLVVSPSGGFGKRIAYRYSYHYNWQLAEAVNGRGGVYSYAHRADKHRVSGHEGSGARAV